MSTHERMTQERLDAIQERVDAATVGPWTRWAGFDDWDNSVASDGREDVPTVADVIPEKDDAAFIAHAREDMPALLAEVERLRALTTVDDDMVERAVEAHRNVFSAWHVKRSPEDSHDRRVAAMRAALDAALGTGEDA